MSKTFVSFLKTKTTVLMVIDDRIYCGKPTSTINRELVLDAEQRIDTKGLFSIPLNYVREICYEESKAYLVIYFKGGNEHIPIENSEQAHEIIEYFRTILPNKIYAVDKPEFFQTIRPTFIAFIVLLMYFLISLLLSLTIDPHDYVVSGFFLGMIFGFASMGPVKVIFISLIIMVIPAWRMLYIMRHPKVFYRLGTPAKSTSE